MYHINSTEMKDQIIELERKYWDGMANLDYEIVKNLTYFPCIVASKDGVNQIDEPTYKKYFDMGQGMKMKIKGLTDAVVELFSKSFATIGYLIEIEVDNQGEIRNSKCVCTSTWILENGDWKCVMHTESDYVKQKD